MDGPNIYNLFIEMQALNAEVHKAEIVNHLRFFKSSGDYQSFLRHYIKMFAKPEYELVFNEFIEDVEDKELKKTLKLAIKTSETIQEAREEPAESVVVVGEVKIKKRKHNKRK